MAIDPRSSDVPPSIDPEKKGLPNGFPTQAALAATLIAAPIALASFTDQGPPPPVTYRTERTLIRFDREWAVSETLVGSDGTRRKIAVVTGDWSADGIDWFTSTLAASGGDAPTPSQKKKELLDDGITSCCGQVDTPPCSNFCGCLIVVKPGLVSCWCKCADEEPGGNCPDDWPEAAY
jgi:hypothetical protein